jgi:hypothetical protein
MAGRVARSVNRETASMMKVLRAVPVIALFLAAESLSPFAGVGAAQEPGTPAQKRACRPDVYRLCAAEIPNVRDITRCLQRKMSQLNPDCRAVFEGTLR